MTVTNTVECFRELTDEFSNSYRHKFIEVYDFFKHHAINKDSLIRKLHLGYTAMRPSAFDFVADEFPWLEEFRIQHGLDKKLNFLETHGLEKPEFKIHIDGTPGNPSVMFNMPIINCTHETTTYWVEPITPFVPVMSCENGTNNNTANGATPHLPTDVMYNIISQHSFINNASLFRSDIYHGVLNKTNRDEYRIMMHWWFPPAVTWDIAIAQMQCYIK